jgi:hypothetical protein
VSEIDEAYRYHVRTGGCQCGAVRFRAAELCDNPHVCHCRMCQKAAGNLFAAMVGVRHEHLTWTRGKPTEFMSSDLAARGFCRDCGTPLYYRFIDGDQMTVSIGTFDDPHSIPLLYQYGNEGKHPSLDDLDAVETAGTTESVMTEDAKTILASNHQHPDHDTDAWRAQGEP